LYRFLSTRLAHVQTTQSCRCPERLAIDTQDTILLTAPASRGGIRGSLLGGVQAAPGVVFADAEGSLDGADLPAEVLLGLGMADRGSGWALEMIVASRLVVSLAREVAGRSATAPGAARHLSRLLADLGLLLWGKLRRGRGHRLDDASSDPAATGCWQVANLPA
jgi:hypothetical protein